MIDSASATTDAAPRLRLGAVLVGGSAAGALAVTPLLLATQGERLRALGVDPGLVVIATVVQITVLAILATLAGLTLGRRVGLGAPLLASLVMGRPDRAGFLRTLRVAAPLGAILALVAVALDVAVFRLVIPTTSYPLWVGFAAALYGGWTEEVLLRFGVLSVIAFLAAKILARGQERPGPAVFWSAIILSAIAFGALHLPATAALIELSPAVVARTLVLNGMLATLFGYLFWKRGLEAAMIAHFTADLVLQLAVWAL
jgi:membrane protease YdiL (CAAX protease family)